MPRVTAVHHPHLSLWQSAVADTLRLTGGPPDTLAAAPPPVDHPMLLGATAHVVAASGGAAHGAPLLAAAPEEEARASALHFHIAEAELAGNQELVAALRAECRAFATCNTAAWLNCEKVYIEYRTRYGKLLYRDWKTDGRGSPDWPMVPWKLPDHAKVAIIADWGTGTDDAAALLEEVMARGADVVLHLGDIYYSGTPAECDAVGRQIDAVFRKAGRRVPIFMTPGNHEYYSLGHGFYPLLDRINGSLPDAAKYRQPASFFGLRTESGSWQFLALDTGQDDYAPSNAADPRVAAPTLRPSELEWHRARIEEFKGRTILLSHHQPFSANAKLNGVLSGQTPVWVNNSLIGGFSRYFDKAVWAWFWGHEHNLVLYQDGFLGLAKGRLVGSAGYEEALDESPYKSNYPVPYQPPLTPAGEPQHRLGTMDGYYNHGYALLDLAQERVDYFQIPSWEGTRRKTLPERERLIVSEQLTAPMLNLLNYVPPRMARGHGGRWDGSPSGAPLTWFNLNKLGGTPKVVALGERELHLAGVYDFLGPLPKKGTLDIRMWNVAAGHRCSLRFAATGPLAADYLGRDPFDTGEIHGTLTEHGDGSLSATGGSGSLTLRPFPAQTGWYPGVQMDFSASGRHFHLCFEDMALSLTVPPWAAAPGLDRLTRHDEITLSVTAAAASAPDAEL